LGLLWEVCRKYYSFRWYSFIKKISFNFL